MIHLANKQNSKHTQECIDCSPSDQTEPSGPEHYTKWSNLDQNENGNKLKIFNISHFSQLFWLMNLSVIYCPSGQQIRLALANPHQMWEHHVLSKSRKKKKKNPTAKEFYHSSIKVRSNWNWMFHRKQHWTFFLKPPAETIWEDSREQLSRSLDEQATEIICRFPTFFS